MESAGLSMALGAFLMGMLMSGSRYHYQIQAQVEPYKGLLMSLFFVAVGMSIDFAAIADHPLRIAAQVVLIVLIKILVMLALGLLFRLGVAAAIRVAFLLAQAGEFGFVLFGTAKGLGVISDDLFVLGVAVISTSMLLTPLLIKLGNALAGRLEPEEAAKIPHPCASLDEALEALDKDREFLTRGGVFSNDMIDAYIALKMEEVTRFRMTTHPIEFDMYYGL
jgi:glutathione-regulated potassium-efflux system protein KefB